MHVHLREPGLNTKKLSKQVALLPLLRRIYRRMLPMPNTNPAIDEESVARYCQEEGRRATGGTCGCYTPICCSNERA